MWLNYIKTFTSHILGVAYGFVQNSDTSKLAYHILSSHFLYQNSHVLQTQMGEYIICGITQQCQFS